MRRCWNCTGYNADPVEHCRMFPPRSNVDGTRSAFSPVRADWHCRAHRFSVLKVLKGLVAKKKEAE